jgi:molybdopterin synthase sulfur carrier subunit
MDLHRQTLAAYLFHRDWRHVKVRIPTPLHSYTGRQSLVEASGETLEQITRDLDRRFPGIRFRIVDEQDQIRPHVKFFVNGEQVRDLRTVVGANDDFAIIQAFSGG